MNRCLTGVKQNSDEITQKTILNLKPLQQKSVDVKEGGNFLQTETQPINHLLYVLSRTAYYRYIEFKDICYLVSR
jgi:hypothetical protein